MLVEFKRDWYDISIAAGKAKLIKSILAMGNSVSPSEPGFVVFGVDDVRRGSAMHGVAHSPQPEAVAQIISTGTSPPVQHELRRIVLGTRPVDVLEVTFASGRPHYATRELPDLRCDVAYIRRGPTIGTMTGTEIETMIREKLALASRGISSKPHVEQEPLEVAFISHDNWHSGGKIVARVTNKTNEPVNKVRATFDIVMKRIPGAVDRREVLCGATLKAGESAPVELDLYTFPVIYNQQPLSPSGNLHNRAVDLTLHVQYADKNGGLQETRKSLTLS